MVCTSLKAFVCAGSEQHTFVANQLASVNRTTYPWVSVTWHLSARPWCHRVAQVWLAFSSPYHTSSVQVAGSGLPQAILWAFRKSPPLTIKFPQPVRWWRTICGRFFWKKGLIAHSMAHGCQVLHRMMLCKGLDAPKACQALWDTQEPALKICPVCPLQTSSCWRALQVYGTSISGDVANQRDLQAAFDDLFVQYGVRLRPSYNT